MLYKIRYKVCIAIYKFTLQYHNKKRVQYKTSEKNVKYWLS